MRVLVVGGGAAGMMAAVAAAEQGHMVTVLERGSRPGQKLRITGKGRCNLTNACDVAQCVAQTPGNGRFLYSALTAFSPEDTRAFFEKRGVPLKVERGNRVFPVSDRAADVVEALMGAVRKAGGRFIQGRAARLLLADGRCGGVSLDTGAALEAQAVIVCTGGLSYPQTGSTGDGYALAAQAGHRIVPCRPSLVPLLIEEEWCRGLQGLSLRNVGLRVMDTAVDRPVYDDFGECLFTHFGLSGPMALSASAHMREMAPGRYRVVLDLKPALTPQQLDARLLRDLASGSNSELSTLARGLLPQKLATAVLRLCGLPLEEKGRDMTKMQRQRLASMLKALPLTVAGFRPVAEAIVTAGGVDIREVDAKTMRSKLVKGLSFAGEVLDVDAYTGGFNLQAAFATGAAAGRHVG